jgi:hypothetical protein
MNLTYRGNTYQTSELTITTSKTQLNATYRGQSYQLNNPLYLANKPVENLIYRGVKQSKVVANTPICVIQDFPPVIN